MGASVAAGRVKNPVPGEPNRRESAARQRRWRARAGAAGYCELTVRARIYPCWPAQPNGWIPQRSNAPAEALLVVHLEGIIYGKAGD